MEHKMVINWKLMASVFIVLIGISAIVYSIFDVVSAFIILVIVSVGIGAGTAHFGHPMVTYCEVESSTSQ